ncbi:hypothetical protein J1N35_013769 [Gossypium stocksii]|uniref:Endonuclease/exonuclease/phosphatase domain-containing protein n=1 Tax=Gossypium stocksii TaxID=47602 RepID=A0A9D3VUA6_9ROSI|nr:hypothetical protein J1N35_013769 [Gossypium stocksii]
MDSGALGAMDHLSKDALDKHLGKRPINFDGSINKQKDSSAKIISSSNSISFSAEPNIKATPPTNFCNVAGDQGNLKAINSNITEVENLEKIKAHYNSVFDESEGFMVPISDNTLDPESIEVMANLLLSQIISKSPTAELVEVASNLKDNNGPSSQGCANSKFPRFFREYNRDHKPDIVSLLETRVNGAKADKIIAMLGFQFSHRVEAIGFSGGQIHWMAINNFNVILASAEKFGSLSKGRRCPHFGDFVDSAELYDLGFKGPPFTWHKGSLSEHLDRALGNEAWIRNFPNCRITHLPKIKSDHRLLLLSLNPNISLPRGRPFRFLAGWFEHPNFDSFFKDNWECSGNFTVSLSKFTQKLKEWNKKVYGNIFNCKKDLIRRNANTQRKSDYFGSYYLNQEDLGLRQELENVLQHEKLFWKQKAMCDWLKFGDRNTKYFHSRTMQSRNNNCISAIRDSDGIWIYDLESIEEEANNFFQRLYREAPNPLGTLPVNRFPSSTLWILISLGNQSQMKKLRWLFLTWPHLMLQIVMAFRPSFFKSNRELFVEQFAIGLEGF